MRDRAGAFHADGGQTTAGPVSEAIEDVGHRRQAVIGLWADEHKAAAAQRKLIGVEDGETRAGVKEPREPLDRDARAPLRAVDVPVLLVEEHIPRQRQRHKASNAPGPSAPTGCHSECAGSSDNTETRATARPPPRLRTCAGP